MKDIIIKLLSSDNQSDIFLGWELLISPQNLPQKDEDWLPYLDCFFGRKVYEFQETFIKYVGGIDALWKNKIYIKWRKTWDRYENY